MGRSRGRGRFSSHAWRCRKGPACYHSATKRPVSRRFMGTVQAHKSLSFLVLGGGGCSWFSPGSLS
jgi:hypothetical protein